MGRSNLSRETRFSGANGDRDFFFLLQRIMSRVSSHTRLVPSLLYVMAIQAYIYTCTKVLIRHDSIDASFF